MQAAVTSSTGNLKETIVASSVVDSSTAGFQTINAAYGAVRLAARHTILVVEDETFVREAMAAVLRSSGYRVLTAVDGREALATCRECARPPDLLLSDMVMPGMSGAHLATLFEAMYPWSQALLMSGYTEELSPCRARLHRTAQLRKPFSIGTLIKAIAETLNAHAPALTA